IIWRGKAGETPTSFAFDEEGKQLAFIVGDGPKSHESRSLWCYRKSLGQAQAILSNADTRIDEGYSIAGTPVFGRDPHWLFFSLAPRKKTLRPQLGYYGARVDIWSYKDRYLQPDQVIRDRDTTKRYSAVIAVDGAAFHRLEQEDSRLMTQPGQIVGGFVV